MTNNDKNYQLISVKEVIKMTSLSRTGIHHLRVAGDFPAAVQIGVKKRIAFLKSEVEAWIQAKLDERAA